MTAHAARREACLKSREDEKERRKRDALRRIAPGFEPQSAPLVPTKRISVDLGSYVNTGMSVSRTNSGQSGSEPQPGHRSVMDDLVDHLAAMESASPKP